MDTLTPSSPNTRSDRRLAQSWLETVDLRRISAEVGTPVFVYSEAQVVRNLERVRAAARSAGLGDRVELYVPFFPNANPHVLSALRDMPGVGLLVQIPSEHALLSRFGFERFIVSPGHVSDDEIRHWGRLGYPTFLSSLDEVACMIEAGAERISVRIDSLGSEKPGVKYAQLAELADMLRANGRQMDCFEVYCGSGNALEAMIDIVDQVFAIFKTHFPEARAVNFAGGHGFDYAGWDEDGKHFDWTRYFEALRSLAAAHGVPEHVRLLFEPARDVLADTGVLMLSVKRDIVSNPVSNLVVTDGSRMLMPSAQYRNRRHHVVFLDRDFAEIPEPDEADAIHCVVRGRSILRNDYVLPGTYAVPKSVDAHATMLILDAGAYCATQHMEFLNVPPAPEVLIGLDGEPRLVTRRGDDLDKWRHLLPERAPLAGDATHAVGGEA